MFRAFELDSNKRTIVAFDLGHQTIGVLQTDFGDPFRSVRQDAVSHRFDDGIPITTFGYFDALTPFLFNSRLQSQRGFESRRDRRVELIIHRIDRGPPLGGKTGDQIPSLKKIKKTGPEGRLSCCFVPFSPKTKHVL